MTTSVLLFVVEDYELIQSVLTKVLTKEGFTVAIANNGKEAMVMLDKEGADYRALITDVNLPGKLTGWDVARHSREINDRLPVIYMTGASAHDWASKGVPNSQLMTKPFALGQLITALSQLINAASATP